MVFFFFQHNKKINNYNEQISVCMTFDKDKNKTLISTL